MTIPFLVAHADVFWKVILAAFVALGLVAFVITRRALANRGTRAEVRALDASNDPGLVRGTLGGGNATTIHTLAATGATASHVERDPELWIDTPDGRVVLHGEITVIAGSRAYARRGAVPRQASRALATLAQTVAATGPTSARLVRVRAGDAVIARGTLGREAASEGTDYRANALQLTLAGPITLAARHPRNAEPRPSWIALAALSCALTFVGYETLGWVGDHYDDRCVVDGDLELTNHNACVIANALPTHRSPLNHLRDALDREPITSAAVLERHLVVARLLEDCPSIVRRVERLGHPDIALAEAIRCRDLAAQEVALVEAGRFEEAVGLDVPLDRNRDSMRPALLVMGHAWQRAAVLLEQQAAAVPDLPGDQDRIDAHRVALHCMSALFSFYASGNAGRIRELAAGRHGEQCAVQLAEIDPNSPLPARLAAQGGLGTAETLLQGDGAVGQIVGPTVWATRLAPAPAATASANARFDDATHRMVMNAMLGDLPAAHAAADIAIPLASEVRFEYDAQFVTLFHPMIDLYSSETKWPVPPAPTNEDALSRLWTLLTPHLALRHGDVHGGSGSRRTALEAAAHGDAAKLVELVGGYEPIAPLDAIAVLPRITAHRAELAALLPWMSVEARLDGFGFPFGTAHQLAERRTMLTLAGDSAEAAATDVVFQRYATALHDRKVLVALALLADL